MYLPVVGLEIHVQAKTASKMFCRCSTDYFSKEPNINTCPVCFGLPGALPVPNEVAFKKCLKLALALNCSINQETKFDRKNYFYPDLPKGYQISQYDQPIGYEGYVEIEVMGDSRRIRIQRVHLEEDTGKSLHTSGDETLLDYNKSGIPLIEIVTYPDFESVDEVVAFAKRLRQIVRYLDVSDAEMQKGQMRFELNISVKRDDENGLPNYKIEVKNIGSISVLEKVVNFEIKRQSELLEKRESITSQTRGLKGMTGETLFQRSKETADDYRYFPEPDIPPIHISNEQIETLKNNMPELPVERKHRYLELGLEGEQADIFVEDTDRGGWFDKAIDEISKSVKKNYDNEDSFQKALKDQTKELAKWTVGELTSQLIKKNMEFDDLPVTPTDMSNLIYLITTNHISGTIAKQVIDEIFKTGKDSNTILAEGNYIQISDSSEIANYAKQVINENPKLVADFAKNPNVIKALVGQVMKLSKGKANPKIAEEELRKILK